MRQYQSQKLILIVFLFNALFTIQAQVGVNTTSPAAGSILDIESTDKGMLVPRVDIADLNTIAPVTGGSTESLLVYNTNTTTGKGFYYWDVTLSRWVLIDGERDWSLKGNTGTNPATDFLGTIDNQNLIVRTNNTERMRILNDGRFLINATTPYTGDRFTVEGAAGESVVNAYSSGGYGVYAEDNGANGVGVWAAANNPFPAFALIANNSNATGTGLLAAGAGGSLNSITGSGASFNGQIGGVGIASTTTGTGLLGGQNSVYTTDTRGSGVSGSSDILGVFGYAGNGLVTAANEGNAGGRFVLDADNDPNTTNANNGDRAQAILAGFDNVTPDGVLGNAQSYFGGYFAGGSHSSGTPSYAYVGMRYGTNSNGTSGTTDFKIIGTGSVSTLINDSNNTPRVMFAPEAPEIVFQDFGTGQLVNGEAYIALDPILKKSLQIDAQHPLKVYVTLEGDCNGVYVTNKSANGFTVKELQGGTSNAPFSWQIVANRADTKDANGNIVSKHVDVRLPIGPGPLKNNTAKKEKVQTLKNNPKVNK